MLDAFREFSDLHGKSQSFPEVLEPIGFFQTLFVNYLPISTKLMRVAEKLFSPERRNASSTWDALFVR
jgi:hypothetical protein